MEDNIMQPQENGSSIPVRRSYLGWVLVIIAFISICAQLAVEQGTNKFYTPISTTTNIPMTILSSILAISSVWFFSKLKKTKPSFATSAGFWISIGILLMALHQIWVGLLFGMLIV